MKRTTVKKKADGLSKAEITYWQNLQSNPSSPGVEEFIRCNIGLTHSHINRIFPRVQERVARDDLEVEGKLGLWFSLKKYDPELGFQFSTFSYYQLRQIIARFVSQQHLIKRPESIRRDLIKLERAIEQIQQETESNDMPSIEALAETIGLSNKRIVMLFSCLDPLSLNNLVSEEEGEGDDWSDFLPSDVPTPEEVISRDAQYEALYELLDRLETREREVLCRRKGLGGRPVEKLREIAENLGMSREGVRHIEERALRHLRELAPGSRLEEIINDSAD